jgi:hypothetical protein
VTRPAYICRLTLFEMVPSSAAQTPSPTVLPMSQTSSTQRATAWRFLYWKGESRRRKRESEMNQFIVQDMCWNVAAKMADTTQLVSPGLNRYTRICRGEG